MNDAGALVKSYAYDAFGVEKNPVTSDTNPWRYCGEYFDKESGNIYLRARYYTPATGRFTQQDGWEYGDKNDPLSLNLYTYANNNPIRYLDPSGHIAIADDILFLLIFLGCYIVGGSVLVTPYGQAILQDFTELMGHFGNSVFDTLGFMFPSSGLQSGSKKYDTGYSLSKVVNMTAQPSYPTIVKSSNESSSKSIPVSMGSTTANPDPGKGPKRNWEKIKEKYLESELKKQNTDPHSIKKEYLGNKAEIKKYVIYVDKTTGQLGIFEKAYGNLVEVTSYFIK